MISQEMNGTITRVGRGTPVGELLRRYWQPAALTDELDGPRSTPRARSGANRIVSDPGGIFEAVYA